MISEDLHKNLSNFNLIIYKLIDGTIISQNKYQTEPDKFFFTVLNKTNGTVFTILDLLTPNSFDRRYLDSVFLLLRSCISDALVFDSIIIRFRQYPEKVDEIIKELYFDHLERTLKNLDLYARLNNHPSELIKQKKQELKASRPEFFDADGKPKFDKISSNPTAAVNTILEYTRTTDNIDLVKEMYGHWDLLSKYEHLGYLSFYMTNRQFMTNHDDDIIYQVKCGLKFSINLMRFISNHWIQENSSLYDEIKSLHSEIMKA